MSSVIKNLAIVLGLVTIAFAGYYIYINKDSVVLQTSGSTIDPLTLAKSQEFIRYRQELDTIRLDLSVFEDPHYRVLRSYSEPVEDQPYGRINPFESVEGGAVDRPAALEEAEDIN